MLARRMLKEGQLHNRTFFKVEIFNNEILQKPAIPLVLLLISLIWSQLIVTSFVTDCHWLLHQVKIAMLTFYVH